jgi:hypothetical protein
VALKKFERERISDSLLRLQAVSDSLDHVDARKIPNLKSVQDCLEDADKILGNALRPE